MRGKLKDADELGIKADLIKLPLETTQEELLKVIDELNKDNIHDGFIVQMPLPKGINVRELEEVCDFSLDTLWVPAKGLVPPSALVRLGEGGSD